MPSSEIIRCKECGQIFDTIESLEEHKKSEKEEKNSKIRAFSKH
jgi:predicted nucleic acid-binding Zn ribbon protein